MKLEAKDLSFRYHKALTARIVWGWQHPADLEKLRFVRYLQVMNSRMKVRFC